MKRIKKERGLSVLLVVATFMALFALTTIGCTPFESQKGDVDPSKHSEKEEATSDEYFSEKQHQELADLLRSDVQPIIDASGMQICVCVKNLRTDAQASIDGDVGMVSASMIKLIIAEAFLSQAEGSGMSLEEPYTLRYDDLVGGTGVLGGYGAGAQISYRDLVFLMISESDNSAANILIRKIGMDSINAEASRLGLKSTTLNRYMMDMDAIASGVENYVSADDIATLLERIYEGTFVSPESSALMLDALEQQQDSGGIRNGLPESVSFAHKTGSLNNARNDGGIVEGENPFVIVILCGGDGFYEYGALDSMARIAEAVYASFSG